jgi:hypothetical protein
MAVHPVHNAFHFAHHFGADAVARQNKEIPVRSHMLSSF